MLVTVIASLALNLPCPEAATCLEANGLVAVSSDPARAELILETAVAAQGQFETRFGLQASPIAVVEDLALYPDITLAMGQAGYRVKPWISPMAMRQAMESQLRPALEQAMADAPQAAIDARVNATLDRAVDNNEKVRHQDAIISHELGHMWLMGAIDWPRVDASERRFYGAPAAPDWLDEVFAVALETPALTGERRELFCAERLEDLRSTLEGYFTSEHPLLATATAAARAQLEARARAQAGAAANQGGTQIMVTSMEALGASAETSMTTSHFYGLSRVLVDFAEETTGGVEVYSDIARHLASGGTLDEWMATQTVGWPGDTSAFVTSIEGFVGRRCDA